MSVRVWVFAFKIRAQANICLLFKFVPNDLNKYMHEKKKKQQKQQQHGTYD